MKNNLYVFFLFFITGLMSCSHHSGLYEHAEKIMSQHPDSVLTLLSTIQDVNDLSEKDRAMYYLLLTEAEDKTYKKHESDSLIAIATEYFDKTDDVKRKAKAWYYRGRVVDDLKDAPRAQDYYLKALQNEMEITDYAFLGRLYNSIGMLYTYQEVYEKAVLYQKKALYCFEALYDSIGQSYVLRDIGRNMTALNKMDSAIFYYEKALYFCDQKSKSSVYRELANLYLDIDNYSKGLEYIEKVLSSPLKKSMLDSFQKMKLETENQNLRYVKTENRFLIESFQMSDIYYKFHMKEEWRPKEEDWNELFKALDETFDKFTRRLMTIFSRLTTTELRVCCLIKANVPPVTIAMLIVTTPTNVSMIRKRLYEKIYPQEKGSSEKFDRFIREYL